MDVPSPFSPSHSSHHNHQQADGGEGGPRQWSCVGATPCLFGGGCVCGSGGEEDSEGGGVNMAVPVHNVQLVPTECGGDVGELSW